MHTYQMVEQSGIKSNRSGERVEARGMWWKNREREKKKEEKIEVKSANKTDSIYKSRLEHVNASIIQC